MTAVLLGGQHAHEHIEIDDEELSNGPPQHLRVQTRGGGGGMYGRSGEVSVYQHTGSQSSAGTEVYQFAYMKRGRIDGFIAIGDGF